MPEVWKLFTNLLSFWGQSAAEISGVENLPTPRWSRHQELENNASGTFCSSANVRTKRVIIPQVQQSIGQASNSHCYDPNNHHIATPRFRPISTETCQGGPCTTSAFG